MSTVSIPDVHERLSQLASAMLLIGNRPEINRATFHGDWFDSFGKFDRDRLIMVCRFINGNIDGLDLGDRIIPADWLLGNHDVHYFFDHSGYVCSGYDRRKKEIINELISADTIRKFKIHTRVDGYLLSHAGYTHSNVHLANPETDAAMINLALRGEYLAIFGPGRARGGNHDMGGPTWLDFTWEFEHIDGVPQIVGHTHGNEVRFKDPSGPSGETINERSWCIDTALRHLAIIDEGNVEIVEIPL